MKRIALLLAIMPGSMFCLSQYNYPSSPMVPVVDNYFGTNVTDNYRWMENIKDSSVVKWFKDQSDYTNSILNKIPGQQTLITEMERLDSVQAIIYGVPKLAGHTFFFTKRLPGEQVAKIYSRQKSTQNDHLLFDPLNYIKGKVMNVDFDVSKDGKYIMLNLSEVGKEISNIRIMDLTSGKLLNEELKFSNGNFLPGANNEIIYIKKKNDDVHDFQNTMNTKFMLHQIGTDVSSDKELLSRSKYPELGIDSSDYPFINFFTNANFMLAQKGNVNRNLDLFYAPVTSLTQNKIEWKVFSKNNDEIKSIIGQGDAVYCLTTKGNNNARVIKVSLPNPDFTNATEIAAGGNDWTITDIIEAKDYLIIRMIKNGVENKNLRYDFATGQLNEIRIPVQGTILILPYSASTNESAVLNTRWTEPFNFYEYNLENNSFSKGPFYVPANYPGMKNLEAHEIEVASYDGTMVPLSIIYDKTKFKNDGSNICLLEGYGAYGISIPPVFDERKLPLLNRGVVYAWAHVRGGGEKGDAWHTSGFKNTKQNTWKDFNACAEYLINNKFTSSQKLGCSSASAGGILIGRAITERPDLYKVAIPKVGCLNPLRQETSPNGPVNIPEFGTTKDSLEFAGLLQMDAMHHIKPGISYPAMLITTGFNDPRVTSWEPGKFAAAMQSANKSTTPTLLFVNYKGGHFGGSTVKEQMAETAMENAFLLWQCGNPEFEMKE
ncbi:MAG TPA: prolyl oligopeptidase family serine peptidase [Chitinophagaceae bacterium]|jgi:Protease II